MSFNITAEMLRKIAGSHGDNEVINGLVQHLPEVMDKYNIDTLNRAAHFLGQLAHESDHFNTFEEYASGAAYEGRRDLGNVKRGDGHRYKGRGPIQITGRFNYRKYGNILGVDLEHDPELAASSRVGTMIAGEYWHQNDLNHLADKDNGKQITRKINGGYNGLEDRLAKIARAKRVLSGVDFEDLQDGLAVEEVVVEPVRLMPEPVVAPVPAPVSAPVAPAVYQTTTVSDVINNHIIKPQETQIPLFVRMDLENADKN